MGRFFKRVYRRGDQDNGGCMIYFIAALFGLVLGAVITYNIMRGEIDDAWAQAQRSFGEKEHYRLLVEQLRKKLIR